MGPCEPGTCDDVADLERAVDREPDEWSVAIERALRDQSEERRLERQAVAREHDWECLVHRIAQHMADALEPEIAQRVREARPGV